MAHSSLIELIQSVAVAANQSTTIQAAARVGLDAICEYTGWPIGHLYLATYSGSGELREILPTDVWHLDDPQRFEQFRKVTEASYFQIAEGLPGHVMQSGKPVWLKDVTKDANFPRREVAEEVGIKAAFAFPILAGTQVVGVLEFFALSVIEPDLPLLEVMSHIGTQLGHVVERQRAEQALRESEQRFRSVAQSANDAIISSDSEGNIIFWNQGAQTIFGYSKDEVLGRPLTILMPERYVEAHQSGMERVNTTGETHVIGKTVELYGLRKTGDEFPIELSLANWTTSADTFYTGIIRDVTERKLATEQLMSLNLELERGVFERTTDLESQRAILATILEATPIAIVFGDSQLRIVNFNQEWAKLMGINPDDARGKMIFDVVPTSHERRILYEQVLAGESVNLVSAPFQPAHDTTLHYYDVHMRPVCDKENKVTGLLSAIIDVTHRVALDRQKDDFIALASHELKTPVAAIKGYAQLGLREANEVQNQKLIRALRIITEQADRMTALVTELLDIAQMQRGALNLNRKPFDLRSMIEQASDEFQVRSPGFTFPLHLSETPAIVNADALRIQQVLLNLIENAVKYSGNSHRVEIGLEVDDLEAVVSVRDYGIGVPAEQQGQLFEQFFRSSNIQQHQTGLGLGLFVSRGIMTQHGGRIWLESSEGAGSTFYFALPLK